MNKIQTISLITLFLIILIVLINFSIKKDNNTSFKIYFFNAGKADAILISNNDKYIMIDTAEESLSQEIINYFKNNNIEKLDYLIITHFDKDHVGSASYIIDNIEVENVLQSNYSKESEYYTAYLDSLAKKEIEPITVTDNYAITLEDMNIIVNGANIIYEKNESNNSSLIVSLNYKNTNFLFMGDSENARIKDFVSSNNKTYNFIKIPYHGNYLKRLDSLISNTSPEYAVITCSNEEGGEQETLNVLDNYNVTYYLTKNGDITITSDGNTINIKQ